VTEVGRQDVVKSLKQYFELVGGGIALDVAESLVPVAIMADLSRPPFSAAIAWMGNTDAGAAAVGENSWAGIRLNANVPRGTRLTLNNLFVIGGAIDEYSIDLFGNGAVPGETIAAQTALDCTNIEQVGTQERIAPGVELIGGNEPALTPNRGYRFAVGYTAGFLLQLQLPPITLVPGSALAVIKLATNSTFAMGAWGYLHVGAGR
jgi:hypothetical protein